MDGRVFLLRDCIVVDVAGVEGGQIGNRYGQTDEELQNCPSRQVARVHHEGFIGAAIA